MRLIYPARKLCASPSCSSPSLPFIKHQHSLTMSERKAAYRNDKEHLKFHGCTATHYVRTYYK